MITIITILRILNYKITKFIRTKNNPHLERARQKINKYSYYYYVNIIKYNPRQDNQLGASSRVSML